MKFYEPLNSGESGGSGVFINLNMQMAFFLV